ncbi:hypothetical protein JVU11DRAFT_6734 [Chiua virens]|nr:hypothetical protein JVU11DRAFT_6734 [Chiua virens]
MREDTNAREELHEELQVKLRTLRHTIDFQEGNVKAFETRARAAEEELVQALNRNHELQERDETKEKLQSVERLLAEGQACEKKLFSDLAKTLNERDALADKLDSFDDVSRELKMCREKYAESQVSLKVLQERSDDQCLTLAATKESMGELQERLHAATELSIESKREIFYLKEQNSVSRTKLDRAEQEIEDKTVSFRQELEEKNASFHALRVELSRKEGVFEGLLEAESLSKKEALGRAQETKTEADSLLAELARKDNDIEELTKRLAAAETPSAEREREVSGLKVRVAELEATEKRLVDRAINISRRYETNDMNDDEKALVALLMQKARGIHDREMVEKTNEIKRRDTVIKQHDARIAQLEDALARRIYEATCSASAKGINEESNSMAIDAAKPQAPSSDHQPEIRGVKHDGPSITATHRTAVNSSIAGPSSRSSGYSTFSKLCREDTDDIANFEDQNPPVATGKRVMLTDDNDIEDESSRPARRVKFARGTGMEKPLLDQGVALATSGTGNKKKTTRRR